MITFRQHFFEKLSGNLLKTWGFLDKNSKRNLGYVVTKVVPGASCACSSRSIRIYDVNTHRLIQYTGSVYYVLYGIIYNTVLYFYYVLSYPAPTPHARPPFFFSFFFIPFFYVSGSVSGAYLYQGWIRTVSNVSVRISSVFPI